MWSTRACATISRSGSTTSSRPITAPWTARPRSSKWYERDGALTLLRERGDTLEQAAWVTRMARLAATEHGADWVVNCDADELWWPRSGTVHDVLAAVPPRFGAVRGMWRHFVPRPGEGGAWPSG